MKFYVIIFFPDGSTRITKELPAMNEVEHVIVQEDDFLDLVPKVLRTAAEILENRP